MSSRCFRFKSANLVIRKSYEMYLKSHNELKTQQRLTGAGSLRKTCLICLQYFNLLLTMHTWSKTTQYWSSTPCRALTYSSRTYQAMWVKRCRVAHGARGWSTRPGRYTLTGIPHLWSPCLVHKCSEIIRNRGKVNIRIRFWEVIFRRMENELSLSKTLNSQLFRWRYSVAGSKILIVPGHLPGVWHKVVP